MNAARLPLLIVALWYLLHAWLPASPEPFFNNDETRHVNTGVFVHDALADGAWKSPRSYAEQYYLRAPALGLLVWPPGYYLLEGAWMACFGTSYRAALFLLWTVGAVAGWGAWRLFRVHGDPANAAWAMALTLALPKVFEFSRYVMLELPTLAAVLWAVSSLERYLKDGRRTDALLAGLATAAALWTRDDAVLLLPYLLFRLPWAGAWRTAIKPWGLVGLTLPVLLAAPLYWFTWKQYGSGLANAATEGTNPEALHNSFWNSVSYYPGMLYWSLGYAALALAMVGIAASIRNRAGPAWAWALILAVYATFTPLAELEARHAIYWLPAWAWFAVRGASALGSRLPRAPWLPAALLLAVTWIDTLCFVPRWHVAGYHQAAAFVAGWGGEEDTQRVLFDGTLNGGFIYALRQHDPGRRWLTLRGDKLLYAVRSDPVAGIVDYAKSQEEVLRFLHDYAPAFLVVEEPELQHVTPGGTLLRKTLAEHPARFTKLTEIPLVSNSDIFKNGKLVVYRNEQRSLQPAPVRELPSLLLGRAVGGQ